MTKGSKNYTGIIAYDDAGVMTRIDPNLTMVPLGRLRWLTMFDEERVLQESFRTSKGIIWLNVKEVWESF